MSTMEHPQLFTEELRSALQVAAHVSSALATPVNHIAAGALDVGYADIGRADHAVEDTQGHHTPNSASISPAATASASLW
jgi:hypothetical protein